MSSSRYLTATARLFTADSAAPAPAPTGEDPAAPTRPWELRRSRPGQSSPEVYTLAALTCILFFAGCLDSVLQLVPLRGHHLVWIVALGLVLTPFALLAVAAVSGLAGDTARRLGAFRKWAPARRTGLFFQAGCIAYAAWATGEPGFIRIFGYSWILLVALNTTAAVLLAARSAQRLPPPPRDPSL